MKNLKILLLSIFAIIGINSCQDEDDLVFTAAPDAEFTFVNTFLDDYVLWKLHLGLYSKFKYRL